MLKILVVGVRSAKAFELSKMYKGKVKFKFVTDQERSLKKVGGEFDFILTCIKFTTHSTERLYSDHVGYIRIFGGCSSLSSTIDSLYQASLGVSHV